MNVAIPKFGETVAPCFEVARVFLVCRLDNRTPIDRRLLECGGCEGFGRVKLLRDKKIDVVICGGIKGFYRDLLQAAGVVVIDNVTGDASEALDQFIRGNLKPRETESEPVSFDARIPLEDLICWTRELFTAHGYSVTAGADTAAFPIDLIAEISCPTCGKAIRIAICCGAHTYRPDQEIQQLHLAAARDFNARVYVASSSPQVRRLCDEYGIELIDPDAHFAACDHPVTNAIPILQMKIAGHEAASPDNR